MNILFKFTELCALHHTPFIAPHIGRSTHLCGLLICDVIVTAIWLTHKNYYSHLLGIIEINYTFQNVCNLYAKTTQQ